MTALIALMLVLAEPPAKPHPIIGKWTATELQSNDQHIKGDEAARFQLVFGKDKFHLHIDGNKDAGAEWTYKLSDDVTPKLIDVVPAQGDNKGNTREGLYRLDGDSLTMIYSLSQRERPTSFELKPDTNWIRVVLKRVKD